MITCYAAVNTIKHTVTPTIAARINANWMYCTACTLGNERGKYTRCCRVAATDDAFTESYVVAGGTVAPTGYNATKNTTKPDRNGVTASAVRHGAIVSRDVPAGKLLQASINMAQEAMDKKDANTYAIHNKYETA